MRFSEKITYGVLEDNDTFRATVVGLLKIRPEVDRVIEFCSADCALKSKLLSTLGFLIVDYRLGGMDGITFLGQPSIKDLQIPKLILTGINAEGKIFEALKYGATGYLYKEDIYSLDSVLEILLSGAGAYITPTVALRLTNYFKELGLSTDSTEILTSREKQVLFDLSSGFSPKEIAQKIDVSISTVRSHIRNIYTKLEVTNQVQLLKKTREKNLF